MTTMNLTRTQRVVLAIGVPLTVATVGWGGLNAVAAVGRGTESVSMAVPVRDGQISANLSNGDITLVSGDKAWLTGTVHYSLIRPGITTSADGTMGVDCSLPVGGCGMKATVSVPPGVSGANLTTDMGNINLNDASLTGTLNLSTSMGDVTARGVTAADVTVKSSMGDITVVFARPPQNVSVTSSMGDVKIVLPPGPTKYRLSANVSMGDVSYGAVPRDSSATNVITASSSMGDITFTQATS